MPVLMTIIPHVVEKRQALSSTLTSTSTPAATRSVAVPSTSRSLLGGDDDADSVSTSRTTSSTSSTTTRGGFFGGLLGPDPTPTTTTSGRTQGGGLIDSLLGVSPTPTSRSTSTSLTTPAPESSPLSTSTELSTISIFESSSNGQIITVTTFLPASTDGLNSTTVNSSNNAKPKSFLENKPLSGFVFALCGLAGLILIVMIATCAMRRRQRKKLLDEAISFDPTNMAVDPYSPSKAESNVGLDRSSSMEKRMSASSSGHGHGHGHGVYGGMSNAGGGHTNYAVPALTYGASPTAHQPQYHQAAYAEHQTAYTEHHGYYGQEQGQDQYYGAGQAQQGWYDQGQYVSYNNYAQPEPPLSAASVAPGLGSAAASIPPTAPLPPLPTTKPHGLHNPPTLPQLNFISASPPTPTGHAGVLHSPMLAGARRVSSLLASGRVPNTPTSVLVSRSATVATSSPYTDTSAISTATVTKSNSMSSATERAAPGVVSPTKHGRSHSRELDPALPTLPLSPMLPATFGRSEEEDKQKRGSVADDDRYLGRGMLKIANE